MNQGVDMETNGAKIDVLTLCVSEVSNDRGKILICAFWWDSQGKGANYSRLFVMLIVLVINYNSGKI
jgi:hypothetical protein